MTVVCTLKFEFTEDAAGKVTVTPCFLPALTSAQKNAFRNWIATAQEALSH